MIVFHGSQLSEEWGFRRLNESTSADQGEVQRAVKALGPPASDSPFVEDDILISDRWVFLPDCYIGSVGALYDREPGQLIRLGSGPTLDDYMWASSKGIGLVLSPTPVDSLRVLHVSDQQRAITSMRRIMVRHPDIDLVEDRIEDLPWTVSGIDLHWGIRELRTVMANTYMAIELLPSPSAQT